MTGTAPDDNLIRRAIARAGLDPEGCINRIAVGFSNDVFDMADRYVFKVGKSVADDKSLRREIFLCNLLGDRVPAPRILASDVTHETIDRVYIIYEKIRGANLYMRWHELNQTVRRSIVAEICDYLRVINAVQRAEYSMALEPRNETWQEQIVSSIRTNLALAGSRQLLTPNVINAIAAFLSRNEAVLRDANMALTYFDAHFDNFIIRDDRIVAMLDFERTDVMSIDFVLDIVQRMVAFPKKYASEAAEPLITDLDYADLMSWFKEFYPELFDFDQMDVRLALYSVEHDLKELLDWPNSQRAATELARIVG